MIAVVNIRGDRLYHEHITWDSASVLVQVGMMPDYISLNGHQFRTPAAGLETAAKLRDRNAVPSNRMLGE